MSEATGASAETAGTPGAPGPSESPASGATLLARIVRHQRTMILMAAALALVGFGVAALFGHPLVGVFVMVGVLLGLVNLLATEWGLSRIVATAADPSRRRFALTSVSRLAVITVLAGVFVLVFWPNGIGAVIGLAVFQPLSTILSSLPLLKEMRKG